MCTIIINSGVALWKTKVSNLFEMMNVEVPSVSPRSFDASSRISRRKVDTSILIYVGVDMGFLLSYRYKFKKNDLNRINAIVTYNKAVRLQQINGIDISRHNYHGAHLAHFIKMNKMFLSADIELLCDSPTNASASGIFPRMPSTGLSLLMADNPAVAQKIELALAYFDKCRVSSAQIRPEEVLPPECVGFSDATEVAALLTRLNDIYENNIGSLHIEADKLFIIQQDERCFVVFYGRSDVKENTLAQMYLAFDLDLGFLEVTGHVLPRQATDFLNQIFALWKRNNYQDDLFSKENLQLVLRIKEALDQWRVHYYEASFFPRELIGLTEVRTEFNALKSLIANLQQKVRDIEAKAKNELELQSPDKESHGNWQELLQVDESYINYQAWLKNAPDSLDNLERCLLALQPAVVAPPPVSASVVSSPAKIVSMLGAINVSPKAASKPETPTVPKMPPEPVRWRKIATNIGGQEEHPSCRCVIC